MINKLLDRLQKVKSKSHGQWTACCPAHDDKHPSLGIKLTDDGKILLHCFSMQCEVDNIVSAVGMELDDLFPPREVNYETKGRIKREYFSPAVVLECLRYESTVLMIAAQDIVNKNVNEMDADRVWLAHNRILDATTYCFK
ncbi:MAG: DNA primase [Patescibacteria group bacterium]